MPYLLYRIRIVRLRQHSKTVSHETSIQSLFISLFSFFVPSIVRIRSIVCTRTHQVQEAESGALYHVEAAI